MTAAILQVAAASGGEEGGGFHHKPSIAQHSILNITIILLTHHMLHRVGEEPVLAVVYVAYLVVFGRIPASFSAAPHCTRNFANLNNVFIPGATDKTHIFPPVDIWTGRETDSQYCLALLERSWHPLTPTTGKLDQLHRRSLLLLRR